MSLVPTAMTLMLWSWLYTRFFLMFGVWLPAGFLGIIYIRTGMADQIEVTDTPTPKQKVLWTREMEKKLLDLLHEQVQLGRKGEGGFRKEAWTAVERKFNSDLNMNLGKENLKNKLKTWKQGFRIMRDLRNTSGFAWNEATQCMDAEDSVWEELLKRKEFKNAKVYKRQPFQYYNELSFIVGNDMAEGKGASTPQETEEGNPMYEPFNFDDGDDIATLMGNAADLNRDEFYNSNQSATSGKETPTSSLVRPKRKKASISGSMDVMCETLKKLHDDFNVPQTIKVDLTRSEDVLDKVMDNVYEALKSMPDLHPDTMIKAYDSFLVETARAKGFLRMTEEERVKYITIKFGGVQ